MPEMTARVALAVLVAVFAWAAGAKSLHPGSWRRALDSYAFPPLVRNVAFWTTPLLELAVVALALTGRGRAASGLALILVGAFTGALLRARARHGGRVPCGCFGKTTERPVSLMLWRNAGLAACALGVLTAAPDISLFEGLRAPTAADAIPAALIVLGLALATWAARVGLASMGDRRT